MKKTIMILFSGIIICMIANSASAQEPIKNLVKVNLLSPLARTGSFFYEHALNEDYSLQMGFFYSGLSIDETKFRGFGLTPELRYYLSEKHSAPQGVFLAPFLRYQSFNVSLDDNSSKATYSSFGGGILVGSQAVFKNKISLDAWIGPSYNSGTLKVETGDEDDFSIGSLDGFGVRFGITLGIGF